MTFGESIQTCFRKYADFDGRAGRSEFWWFMLFTTLVSWAADLVLSSGLSSLVSLAMLLPILAVGARRLHDTDCTTPAAAAGDSCSGCCRSSAGSC